VHCAGLEESVLDAEIFGQAEGAREGAIARANGGTLLLDEVSQLPGSVQNKLLRFLQEGLYERLGGAESETADVRVVAASEVDLHHVETFRDELYYRLNVVTLRVPSLRQRWEDLPALAMHFLQVHAKERGKHIVGFSDRTLHVLQHFDWADNVRELEHCVERAVVLCTEREVQPKHLPREVLHHSQSDSGDAPRIPGASMADIEKYAILSTLELVRGSTRKAAEILGISPRKIQYRLAEYRESGPSGVPAVKPTKS
jgi:DNA-binding NtrC family response regulator